MSVFLVFLRRPRGLDDRRNDPFWEFGSFGSTDCHGRNLLHPRRTRLCDGDRLAFAQGGRGEIRVVGLTPPIVVGGSTGRVEVRWSSRYRPLPCLVAPLLIDNAGRTAFARVKPVLRDTDRGTWVAATAPSAPELAKEIVAWFSRAGLPRVRAYLEAIEGPDGRWFGHAVALEFARRDCRLVEFGAAGATGARKRCRA